jgi:hypothetical protein
MIEFQEFICIMPMMQSGEGHVLPESHYRVRVNLGEILDYGDATGDAMIHYEGHITVINYHNGATRFLKVEYNIFHSIMMKFKASQTRYLIQTKFN